MLMKKIIQEEGAGPDSSVCLFPHLLLNDAKRTPIFGFGVLSLLMMDRDFLFLILAAQLLLLLRIRVQIDAAARSIQQSYVTIPARFQLHLRHEGDAVGPQQHGRMAVYASAA